MDTHDGYALGLLAQHYGPNQRSIVYLSKPLDAPFLGWLACLWALAAVAILIQEALKLVPYANLAVYSSHSINPLITHQLY